MLTLSAVISDQPSNFNGFWFTYLSLFTTFISLAKCFIYLLCWQLRLKISKNKHSSEQVTQGISYCHSLMGFPRVTELTRLWASVVWERGTWNKQPHPNVFFKLLKTKTFTVFLTICSTVPFMILVILEVLSSVAIFFLSHLAQYQN